MAQNQRTPAIKHQDSLFLSTYPCDGCRPDVFHIPVLYERRHRIFHKLFVDLADCFSFYSWVAFASFQQPHSQRKSGPRRKEIMAFSCLASVSVNQCLLLVQRRKCWGTEKGYRSCKNTVDCTRPDQLAWLLAEKLFQAVQKTRNDHSFLVLQSFQVQLL